MQIYKSNQIKSNPDDGYELTPLQSVNLLYHVVILFQASTKKRECFDKIQKDYD